MSQCVFVFVFSIAILGEPLSAVRLLLVLLCVAGVCALTWGDDRLHAADGDGSGGSGDGGGSAGGVGPVRGSMRGDLLLGPGPPRALKRPWRFP